MKRKIITTLSILLLGSPATVFADEPVIAPGPGIMIVEVQTGSEATGTEEFVEVYNASDEPIDITGWRLQYRPASQAADAPWLESHTKSLVVCAPSEGEETCQEIIEPRARRVFANYETVENALPMTGGFAEVGGQLRLAGPVEDMWQTIDFIGYGTAQYFKGSAPALPAKAGQSIKRQVVEDVFVDSGNNAQDFFIDCGAPTPGENSAPQPPLPQDSCEPEVQPATTPLPISSPAVEADEATPTPGQGAGPVSYLPLLITEVFPDPASPQQDSTNEFVEIFNPNNVAVEVEDYVLQTGNSFQYKVTLGSLMLAPQAYALVTSGDSALSLSNSGTAVRLLDPAGEVRDETPNYGKATSGHSWIKTNNGWQWSTTPTPAAANIVAAPMPKTTTTAKAKTASASKAAVKTAATSTQAVAPAAVETQVTEPPLEAPAPNFWVLGLVGALAVGYGIYEYRQDIGRALSSRWAQLKGKSSGAEG